MLLFVISGFVLACLAPWLQRVAGRAAGAVLALLPLAMFVYFATFINTIAAGEVVTERWQWAESLGIHLTFYLDGLSLLFALLITGIGTLIVFYAGTYLDGHKFRGRFFAWLLAFQAAMLGLVLADNIISMFVFWELTSITSYFLIGFDHHRKVARDSALQALLVTGGGGLALLAGLIMMALVGGSMDLSTLLNSGDVFREHALYVPILLLLLAGAFTKSAQFPFHFWLPNAMEAPTPVSAYLHSSTMVKAGIYLMARVSPAMGGTELWMILLSVFGGATMVIGAYLAIQQVYLKRILAYSTISALGVLTFLLGLGASGEPGDAELSVYAAKAFGVFLLGHALYKATLFLVAGTVTHETGEKDVTKLGGLRKAMPITAVAAVLAALSMAGFPPFFGFLGKELLFEATLKQPSLAAMLTAASVLTGILFVIVSCLVALKPFFGQAKKTPQHAHEAPFAMWIGPSLLALAGLLIGVLPAQLGEPLIAPVVSAVLGLDEPVELSLTLWHGINTALILGTIVLTVGVLAYFSHRYIMMVLSKFDLLLRIGPAMWYEKALAGTLAFAGMQTRFLQSGYLRMYLLLTMATTVGLVAYSLFQVSELPIIPELPPSEQWPALLYEHMYTLIVAGLILTGTYGAVHSKSRLTAIAALGVVGYGVALLYIIYGAPDLAITQFLIETLTVILFVLVFYHLPEFPKISRPRERMRDLFVAVTAGTMMTVLVLVATSIEPREKVSDFYAAESVNLGHGRNIVNVILVDFRATDTLGEVVVLMISAIGVLALLKLKSRSREDQA